MSDTSPTPSPARQLGFAADARARRVYPLDPHTLSQEQIAVVFAMTSRSPEPFDEIAKKVTEAKAADFHQRWVVGYGHASVAEHAVLHMAVENVSRLVCDDLEDNRLASYTELSSRYQVIDAGSYLVPPEFAQPAKGKGRKAGLLAFYREACDGLFQTYHALIPRVIDYLKTQQPQEKGENEKAYTLRMRRQAMDHVRILLPASTLTNVGVTMNARVLEHAITKLLSSDLAEAQQLGSELKTEGRKITPTLIKYATDNRYLTLTRRAQTHLSKQQHSIEMPADEESHAKLVDYDRDAQDRVVAALLYRDSDQPFEAVRERAKALPVAEKEQVIDAALRELGPHDAPLRELEYTYYTFDMLLDYGAYRELKRHRMQSYIAQALSPRHGYVTPDLVREAGCEGDFAAAMKKAERAYSAIADEFPAQASYVVTHAHRRRVLCKMNLRECYHLFKLRTSPQAHFTLRRVMLQAMEQAQAAHPVLFKGLRLRS
ncbi:MAG: FAD-dependent thymidylate synthase [Chloroflexi bacterium]|nr:FAD-dependent thymidylate synthase [Chloroflexota bacterium]